MLGNVLQMESRSSESTVRRPHRITLQASRRGMGSLHVEHRRNDRYRCSETNLDWPLAERVTRSALACAGSRGVLLIAHSTAGLERCDRVLRLDEGVVVEMER
jgi:hypothetical protein